MSSRSSTSRKTCKTMGQVAEPRQEVYGEKGRTFMPLTEVPSPALILWA